MKGFLVESGGLQRVSRRFEGGRVWNSVECLGVASIFIEDFGVDTVYFKLEYRVSGMSVASG